MCRVQLCLGYMCVSGPSVLGCVCVSGARVCQIHVCVGYMCVSDTSVCRGKVCVWYLSSRVHASLIHVIHPSTLNTDLIIWQLQ